MLYSNYLFYILLNIGLVLCEFSKLSKWDVRDSFIANAIRLLDSNLRGNMKYPLLLKNYPPLISTPKRSERSIGDGEIPQYVIDYAPFVHLYSEEKYLPYDINEFVKHFYATFDNGTIIKGTERGLNTEKLAHLPKQEDIYLTSFDDFDKDPEWITGLKNKPSLFDGKIKHAPATLIVVDKGNGWVDAFWFYFYSFNLGPFVMGSGPYGNHVGDWEHSLVRFYKGNPVIVWMSAHGGGGAYYYKNLEKDEDDPRHPIIYSARGTHANYVSVGQHPHDLPYDILSDFTDRGPLWNPSKNYLAYTFDGDFVYPNANSSGEYKDRELKYGNWLSFMGHWGDKQLSMSDSRQLYLFIGGHKYIDGPHGPLMKNLVRLKPCERHKWWNFWNGCTIRKNIKWGIGVESEGYNCGNVFQKVRPKWFKKLIQRITWGGGFCFAADFLNG